MPKTAIITDSNSGINQITARQLGIYVVPMPFTINQKEYEEGVDLTRKMFFDLMAQGATVSTSMPSLGKLSAVFDQALQDHDEAVYMPMSSGLSGSYESARLFAEQYYQDKVYVVDDQRISATLEQSVYDAIHLANLGRSAPEIKATLEAHKRACCIYLTVQDLTYLKKGGRITPAVATLGNLLKIKPVMNIDGGKLDLFAKTRTLMKAEKIMIEAVKHDIETRIGPNIAVRIAHANCHDDALDLQAKLREAFPGQFVEIVPLTLSICCHTGPTALGCGCIDLSLIKER